MILYKMILLSLSNNLSIALVLGNNLSIALVLGNLREKWWRVLKENSTWENATESLRLLNFSTALNIYVMIIKKGFLRSFFSLNLASCRFVIIRCKFLFNVFFLFSNSCGVLIFSEPNKAQVNRLYLSSCLMFKCLCLKFISNGNVKICKFLSKQKKISHENYLKLTHVKTGECNSFW